MQIEKSEKVLVDVKTFKMSAKCSDCFAAIFYDSNGKEVLDYDGYVPSFFPGQHFGDYVELDIDIETGQILNWSATKNQVQNFFNTVSEKGAD